MKLPKINLIHFGGYKKSLENTILFDSATQVAIIRSSICTGEKVAGFKSLVDGHFTEVMVVRNAADEELFKKTYGIDSVKVEY